MEHKRAGVNGWKEFIADDGRRVHILEYNSRPLYMRWAPKREGRSPLHILFFLGRRWALTTSEHIDGIADPYSLSEVASFMSSTFLTYWRPGRGHFKAGFVSDPTDTRTASDDLTPTNSRMKWYQPLTGPGELVYSSLELDVSLTCSLCDKKETRNICHNDGVCSSLNEWEAPTNSLKLEYQRIELFYDVKKLSGTLDSSWGYCKCPSHTKGWICEALVLPDDSGCYTSSNHTGSVGPIPDCLCHESCRTCGTVGSSDDCFSCFEGHNLRKVWENGAGCCGADCL